MQGQDRFSLKTIHAYITLPLSLPCPWLVWFVSYMWPKFKSGLSAEWSSGGESEWTCYPGWGSRVRGSLAKPLEGKPFYTLPDLSKNVPLSKACSKCNKTENWKLCHQTSTKVLSKERRLTLNDLEFTYHLSRGLVAQLSIFRFYYVWSMLSREEHFNSNQEEYKEAFLLRVLA